jgi:hypothetical protein
MRRYPLKYADKGAGEALGLARYGAAGKVIGKRAGFTQNIGGASNYSLGNVENC